MYVNSNMKLNYNINIMLMTNKILRNHAAQNIIFDTT